ncbi:MAG: tetratricopeptide repeat protein [wastewater metagenome]|nr:tetratricopeptide repeat protein [Candidatus Loosdrechtia aerotolerans]
MNNSDNPCVLGSMGFYLENTMGVIGRNLSVITITSAVSFLAFLGGCDKKETSGVIHTGEDVVTGEYSDTVGSDTVQEDKKEIKLPENMTAEEYYQFGLERIKKGGFDEAIAAWEKVLTLDPMMFSVYDKLGKAYYTQGKFHKAAEVYRKQLDIRPNEPMTYFSLGVVYRMNEQYEDAVEMQMKAISLKPEFASAYNELGLTYCKQRRLEEAIEAHKHALELDPGLGAAHNYLGVAYLLKGMNAEAEMAFNEFKKYEAGKNMPSQHGAFSH